jgi:hypothetical protein
LGTELKAKYEDFGTTKIDWKKIKITYSFAGLKFKKIARDKGQLFRLGSKF